MKLLAEQRAGSGTFYTDKAGAQGLLCESGATARVAPTLISIKSTITKEQISEIAELDMQKPDGLEKCLKNRKL